jgi:predicted nicotinamide N-methyase
MLRIRLRNALPPVCAPDVPFPVAVHLTNESGSNVHVSTPVKLVFQVLHADDLTPNPNYVVAVHSSAGSDKKPSRVAVTDLLGRCDVVVSLVSSKKRVRCSEDRASLFRIHITAELSEPVHLSPVPSPTVWPVILVADSMHMRDVKHVQPVTPDVVHSAPKTSLGAKSAVSAAVDADAAKREEKKRRSAAFAANEWLLSGHLSSDDHASRDLIVAASSGADSEALGIARCIPVMTNAFTIDASSMSAPTRGTVVSPEAQIVTVPLAPGTTVRLFERQTLVGPGFGTVVWDCGVVLAQYLFHHAATLKLSGARVWDNATGTGFVALALAALGAHVTATDIDSITAFAESNVALNADLIADGKGSVTVVQHVWGSDVSPVVTADSGKPFDFIIASEVVYDTALFQPLIASLVGLSDRSVTILPNGAKSHPVLLLSGRRRAGCEFSTFLTQLSQYFVVEAVPLLNASSPPTIRDVAFGCCGMSKTKYPPLLFRCIRKEM